MADNTTLNSGSGGDVIASDDIGPGVKYQRVKLTLGADGTNEGDVASGNPMPVNVSSALPAGTNNIGDVDVLSLPALAAGTNNIGDVDVLTINGVAPAFGSGARGATVQRVTIATDDSVPVTGTFWQATQPVSGTVTANLAAGTNNIGDVDVLTVPAPLSTTGGGTEATALRVTIATDSTGVVSIDDNGGSLTVDGTVTANLAAGTNNIGDVDVLTLPATAGTAASTINSTSSDGGTALTSTAQAIKGSAGALYGYYIYNPNAAAVFVQFYNTAQGSVTVGTTSPLFMITIPAASAANLWMQPGGITFGTAMSWSATSTAGGNGAPTTALDAVCWYA